MYTSRPPQYGSEAETVALLRQQAPRVRRVGAPPAIPLATPPACNSLQEYRGYPRMLMSTHTLLLLLVMLCAVGILFLSLHIGVCRGEDPHSAFLPEPFRIQTILDTPTAQTLASFVARFQAEYLIGGAATEPGSASTLRYADSFLQHAAVYADFYTTQAVDSTVFVTDACSIAITINGAAGVTITNPSWFRPVKSTCKAMTAVIPSQVDAPVDADVALAALTGTVALIFQDLPFSPLEGDAHTVRTNQPMAIQVDRRMRALFQGTTTLTVTVTATITQRTAKTYIIRPTLNALPGTASLLYVGANLDAAYRDDDNWGSLALLLQLMDALRFTGAPRDRTAFVLSSAGSMLTLGRQNTVTNALDFIVLSECGLPNGRDALYTDRTALGQAPLLRAIATHLLFAQNAYLSGTAAVPNHATWTVSSYSGVSKTIPETTAVLGVAGQPVVVVEALGAPGAVGVSIAVLVAQLATLTWMLEAGSISGTGVRALFA